MKEPKIGDIVLAQYANESTVPVVVAKVEEGFLWHIEGHVIRANSSAYEVKWGRLFSSEAEARNATPLRPDEILCWPKENPAEQLLGELILLLSTYHGKL